MYYIEVRELYNRLKNSAKKRGIPFELTLTDLNNLSFPITCPITNLPLSHNRGQQQDNSYSIDRIDSNLPYRADNIVVISNRANRIKNDGTLEEIEKLAEFYKNLK